MGTMKGKPSWWSAEHAMRWDLVKEAVRRDWEQTKFDLHLKGGHELNQSIGDTVKQARGTEAIPADDRPNPPKVIGEWTDVELPHRYGYAARDRHANEAWSVELEQRLRQEWESLDEVDRDWDNVRTDVRRGYEARR